MNWISFVSLLPNQSLLLFHFALPLPNMYSVFQTTHFCSLLSFPILGIVYLNKLCLLNHCINYESSPYIWNIITQSSEKEILPQEFTKQSLKINQKQLLSFFCNHPYFFNFSKETLVALFSQLFRAILKDLLCWTISWTHSHP